MVIKEVLQIGDSGLRRKAKKIPSKDIRRAQTRMIVGDLKDSFLDSMVVGMAAPQIGKSVAVMVTEIKETKARKGYDPDPFRIYINPTITWSSKKETVLYEGCVSVPGIFGPVRRPEKITIEAYDEDGRFFKLKADGLLSKVIQHEYDHLNGILFTDRVTDNKLLLSKKEYLKQKR